MHQLLLNAIILALSGSQDWPTEKYKHFCNDINPLLTKKNINYLDLCPLYDRYIHKLDKVEIVIDDIEK